jgi:hypothetical protein
MSCNARPEAIRTDAEDFKSTLSTDYVAQFVFGHKRSSSSLAISWRHLLKRIKSCFEKSQDFERTGPCRLP